MLAKGALRLQGRRSVPFKMMANQRKLRSLQSDPPSILCPRVLDIRDHHFCPTRPHGHSRGQPRATKTDRDLSLPAEVTTHDSPVDQPPPSSPATSVKRRKT